MIYVRRGETCPTPFVHGMPFGCQSPKGIERGCGFVFLLTESDRHRRWSRTGKIELRTRPGTFGAGGHVFIFDGSSTAFH